MAGRMHFVSYVSQNLITGPKHPSRLEVRHFPRRSAGDAVSWLLEAKFTWREHPIPVGITLDQSDSQQITRIALSTSTRAVAITIDESSVRDLKLISNDRPFLTLMKGCGQFICKDAVRGEEESSMNTFVLVGVDFARLAVLIRKYVGIDVRGVDLGTLIAPNALAPWSPGRLVCARVLQNANPYTINKCWDIRVDEEAFFMRAWISECVAERCQSEVTSSTPVDTTRLNRKELECLENMVAETFWLEQLRPKEVVNDFGSVNTRKDGKIEIQNQTYKNKIRRSERQMINLITTNGEEHTTRARGVKGKLTTLSKVRLSGPVESVKIVGRQDPTNSERLADLLLLSVLQGKKTFQNSPFIRLFWFPAWKKFRPPEDTAILRPERVEMVINSACLNASQERVVRIAGEKERCIVVHGPPGTGKTTTIAAIARVWDLHDCPVWIIAHSNVAVKNIALALHKRGVVFRILVSKEFYEEWHEHLYDAIRDRLIRSDELPESPGDLARLLGECCIMLSTLGMLSNPALEERGLFREIPVERLIVDEASQIRTFEFLHLFEMFEKLEKVFFFGDPRQLPPFNHDQVKGMKTVFDLEHLNQPQRKFLLNVQYRMMVPLGSFISTSVYQNQLNSVHDITSPDCVLFVDVPSPHGIEAKEGTSWKNEGEVRSTIHLVKKYYKHLEFAVVTPYDGQRGLIERSLKAEDLPWENAVFNIDSFQGNERDYIIISLVRTDKPGFLTSLNRLNVMLTRCKKGMVIVTNKDFLITKGSDTLVARFASYWKNAYGHAATWADWKDVADGRVDVPGVPAPNPTKGRSSLVSPYSMSGYAGVIAGASQGSARVPQKYQNATGGFDVSRLFAKTRPKVQTPTASYPRATTIPKPVAQSNPHHLTDFSSTSEWDVEGEWAYDQDDVDPHYLDYVDPLPSFVQAPAGPSPQPSRPSFNIRSFPSLVPMSTEDGSRLRASSARLPGTSAWSRGPPDVGPHAQFSAYSGGAKAWDPTSTSANSSYTRASLAASRGPRSGAKWSTVGAPQAMSTPAHWPTFGSLDDEIPGFNPAEFDAWASSSSANVAAAPARTSTVKPTFRGIATVSPVPSTKAWANDTDDDNRGGWTRVERRRGHGRKRGFNYAARPKETTNTAPSSTGTARKKKSRGYRYWVGLD